MIKLAAISPRTQSLQINQGPSSPESQQFEQLFSEKSHATLGAKSPDLANSIINFKVVESDIESDTAAGIFVCLVGDSEIHVPIVLSAGQVQAPEVFYSPMAKKFFPLTNKFIDFSSKTNTNMELGSSVPTKDIDDLGTPSLSGITSPPQSMGKFSGYELPILVSQVTNTAREKVSSYLKDNKKVLSRVVRYHGRDVIKSLAYRSKSASAVDNPKFVVLNSDSDPDMFRKVFGNRSKLAYRQSLIEGYTAADFRKNAAELVENNVSKELKVIEPGTTGTYKILKNDGKTLKSLILVNPKNIGRSTSSKYLCILENGDYILTDKIAAIQTNERMSDTSVLSSRLNSKSPTYRKGTASFIRVHDGIPVNGTMPERLTNFTSSKESALTCRIEGMGITISFLNRSGGFNTPIRAKDSDTAFVPYSYKPIYLKKELSVDSFITSADVLRRALTEGMSKVSSAKVKIKKSIGGYVVNGSFLNSPSKTVEKLASLGASVVSTRKALQGLREGQQKEFDLVLRSNLTKISSIFGPAPAAPPPMPPAAAAAPMPPGMAGPPPGMPPMGGDPSAGMAGPDGLPPEQGQMLETAADTGNKEILDTALASVLIDHAGMEELMTEYAPKLVSGLDSLCRILLTMQLNFGTMSEQLGPEEYTKFLKKVTKSLHSLGDIIITIVEGKSISGGVNNASIEEY